MKKRQFLPTLLSLAMGCAATFTLSACDETYTKTETDGLIAALQTQIDGNKSELDAKIAALTEEYKAKDAELLQLIQANQQAIAAIETEYTAKLAELNKADEDNAKAIADLTSEYNAKVAELEKADSDNVSALAALRTEYESKIAELNKADENNAKAIADLTSAYNAKVAELEEKIAAANATIQSNKTELNATITALTESFEEKVSRLDQLVEALENENKTQDEKMLEFANKLLELEAATRVVDVQFAPNGDLVVTFGDGTTKTVVSNLSGGTAGIYYQRIAGKDEYCVMSIGHAEDVDIVIPSTYKGLPVTKIASNAFANSFITSIVIPDSVTTIGMGAFYGCEYLTEITLPFVGATKDGTEDVYFGYIFGAELYGYDDMYAVPDQAEYIPSSLKNVTITSATSIGDFAFYECRGLMEIELPDSVTTIGMGTFYDCSSLTEITIPEGVTSMGAFIFGHCVALSNVTLPKGMTSMGEGVFAYCTALTNIIIPEGTIELGLGAFAFCSSLTSITIPDSVTSIGDYALAGCNFTEIIVSANNENYQAIDGNLYSKDGTFFIQYATGKTETSFEMPENVTKMGGYAFAGCSNLTSVVISDEITEISEFAFADASGLTSISIPKKVTTIGDSSFYGCSSLTEIVIPDSVTTICDSAFEYCSGLTSVIVPDSVTEIGYYAFAHCENLTEITLPFVGVNKDGRLSAVIGSSENNAIRKVTITSATSIGDYAFYNYNNLTEIVIPDNVTSIGDYAFAGCSGLTSVIVSDSVTEIGYSAFARCENLTEITLPFVGASKDNTSNSHFGYIFGASSYSYNSSYVPTSLKKVTITSATSIGDYAFYNCNNLTEIVIPDSVTSIEGRAFYNCSGLTEIVIPDSVTSIGNYAFTGCENLTEITLPFVGATKDGIEDAYFGYIFGAYDFKNNYSYVPTSLKKVTITSATSIGYGAFYECVGLRSITIPNSVTSIGYYAFYDCSSLTEIVIPDSVTSIGGDAFAGCSGLTEIVIPNSVTSIGNYAFTGCSSLTIYCEAVRKPSGWSTLWNYSGCPVVWKKYEAIEVTIPEALAIAETLEYGVLSASVYCVTGMICEITNTTYGNFYILDEDGNKIFVYGCYNEDGTILYNKMENKPTVGDIVTLNAPICNHYGELEIIEAWLISLTKNDYPEGLQLTLLDDGTYAVMGYTGTATKVVIPSTYLWKPVTIIGDSAFKACSGLTSLTIPDSVEWIGDYAFSGCNGLTRIVLPDSVTTIGDGAFWGCNGLTSLTIPDSVEWIGDRAFYNCSSLTYNKNDGLIYLGNLNNPYLYLSSVEDRSITTATINNACKFIGCNAFTKCKNLTEIVIPDSVTSIGNYAFEACSSLTEIVIPNSVTSIGEYAFYGCSGLTSIVIPDSVTSIGNSAFYNCSSLTEITLPFVGASKDNTTNTHFGYIFGASSYSNNYSYVPTSLKKVTITSATSIGGDAFYDCRSLTEIVIPDGVTTIGDYAFRYCSSLTIYCEAESQPSGWSTSWNSSNRPVYWGYKDGDIEKPESYTAGLTFLLLEDGTYAVTGYTGTVTEVIIPSKYQGKAVTSIGGGAFNFCDRLTSIVIPDSVTSIGIYAFEYCSNLTSIEIPDSVTSIGSGAFYKCGSLTSITISDSVTNIDEGAFEACSSLMSIVIPDSVTTIGNYAFENCSGLTIYCEAESQPSGWSTSWNSSNRPVVWGYKDGDAEKPVVFTKTITWVAGEQIGAQYVDESYVVSEDLTISSHNNGCHFTTQLRIYDSSSNNGHVIFQYSGVVSKLTLNIGYKRATMAVYGSTDGETWQEIGQIATTTTGFLDYELNVDATKGYTYIKLDAVGNQLRVKTIEAVIDQQN